MMAFCYYSPSLFSVPSVVEKPMDKRSLVHLPLIFTLIACMALLASLIR